MGLFSRSIPGLFGGVSQQIPAMRATTQGDIQENATVNIVDGLTKRNGFRHLSNLSLTSGALSIDGAAGAVHTHFINRDTKDILVIKNGNLMVYSRDTGIARAVTTPNGTTYLATATPERSIKCLTVADYTFILNTEKVVATSTTDATVNDPRVAYVVVKQAVASIAWGVVVDGVNCPYSSGATTDTGAITSGLISSIAAARPGYTVGSAANNVIRITKPTGVISVQTADGFGNQAMYCLSNGVPKYSDLPAIFETGFVITITGAADTFKTSYFIKWDGTRYIECKKPGIVDTLDRTTMPHQLVPQPDGSYIFQPVTAWGLRLIGDDISNPLPSFVGSAFNGLTFYRNRLGLLCRDAVILSKAGKYYDFFASTATAVLDTDPIDLSTPSTQVVTLTAAVPFNKDLLLCSEKQQFILTSGDTLSPKAAKIVPTTSFEMDPGLPPVSLGNKLVFATNQAAYSKVSLYQVSANFVTNERLDIAEHIPRYIPSSALQLAASEITKALAVVGSTGRNELLMFKYEEDEQKTKLTQKAWGKLILSNTATQTARILKVQWDSFKLYLVIHYRDTAAATPDRYSLEVLDLQYDTTDAGIPYYLCLDRKVALTPTYSLVNDESSITVPYWERGVLQVVQQAIGTSEPQPLTIKATTFNSGGTMTLTFTGDKSAAPVWVGKQFLFRWRYSEFVFVDANGVPIQSSRIRLKQLRQKFSRAGSFRIKVTPFLRDTFTYPFVGKVTGVPGLGLGQGSLSDGELAVSIGTRPTGTTVDIEADSYFPCTFPYAEWTGDVVMRAQR